MSGPDIDTADAATLAALLAHAPAPDPILDKPERPPLSRVIWCGAGWVGHFRDGEWGWFQWGRYRGIPRDTDGLGFRVEYTRRRLYRLVEIEWWTRWALVQIPRVSTPRAIIQVRIDHLLTEARIAERRSAKAAGDRA